MALITLTSKRQATFPVRLCEELNLSPGDLIEVEAAELSGERVWVLRPRKMTARPWLGCLGTKTQVEEHSMAAVRTSIAAGRRRAT
jgi:bifunctional DNA-binding transcriptional regulator/antitoxin component of YhaV-PrlF toxin-antitoxin module